MNDIAFLLFTSLLILSVIPYEEPPKPKKRKLSCTGFRRLEDGSLEPIDPRYFD